MTGDAQRLSNATAAFRKVRVLCVGDLMLDRYVYGKVSRVSAEAPIPIMTQQGERAMLGAIGNVARNVVALGGAARIIAIVGDDDAGAEVARLVSEEDNLEADLVAVSRRRTTVKTRFVARGQQLLRADQEDTHEVDDAVERKLVEAFEAALPDAHVVLLSDYAKGCLGGPVVRAIVRACNAVGKPVLADQKSNDFGRFDGVDVIKPNAAELAAATGIPCTDDRSTAASARKALELADFGAVLVTRSEYGMTLVERDRPAEHFLEKTNEVFDVSGAGDTALATLGLAIAAGTGLSDAARLANKACRIVVAKVGTAVIYASELQQALRSEDVESAGAKIARLMGVMDRVARWRVRGLRVGLTNGCFDLIHAGHVSLLAQAKDACDRLIVALNSDASVLRLKGEGRPINGETARAIVLASFRDVDAVVVFEEDTPMRLIDAIRPDVLIKGADYTEDKIVGADFVKSYGGRIFLAELAPELSTTNTLKKVRG